MWLVLCNLLTLLFSFSTAPETHLSGIRCFVPFLWLNLYHHVFSQSAAGGRLGYLQHLFIMYVAIVGVEPRILTGVT